MSPYAGRMKRVWWVLAVVLGIVLLLVVADRITAAVVESGAEDAWGDEGATGQSVAIGGFPVLTQLAAGELGDVSGSADTMVIGDVTIEDVAFTGSDVQTEAPHLAGAVEGAGTLPLAGLEELVAQEAGEGTSVAVVDGELTLTGTGALSAVTVAVEPRAEDGGVVAEVSSIAVGGATVSLDDLPDFLDSLLGDVLDGFEIPLGLPEEISVDAVEVTDAGLRATLSGQDVVLDDLVTE